MLVALAKCVPGSCQERAHAGLVQLERDSGSGRKDDEHLRADALTHDRGRNGIHRASAGYAADHRWQPNHSALWAPVTT